MGNKVVGTFNRGIAVLWGHWQVPFINSVYSRSTIFSILQFQHVGVEVPKWIEKWDGQERKNSWFSLKIHFPQSTCDIKQSYYCSSGPSLQNPSRNSHTRTMPCHFTVRTIIDCLHLRLNYKARRTSATFTSSFNIKTLLISQSCITLQSDVFLAPVYINHKPFQGFIWLILANPHPSWRSLYSDRSQTLQAIVVVFPHDRYCKAASGDIEKKEKLKSVTMKINCRCDSWV